MCSLSNNTAINAVPYPLPLPLPFVTYPCPFLGTSKARKLKSCFDAGLVSAEHMHEYSDPHVVADALKAYLRDLPEPLMTTDFYEDWMTAARVQVGDVI